MWHIDIPLKKAHRNTAKKRINLLIHELMDELGQLRDGSLPQDPDYPFIMAPGERRTETSNTIIRNCEWHEKRYLRQPSYQSSECGHVSLPNGAGIDYQDSDGTSRHRGVALNELTYISSRDVLADTPWHKHIPEKLEKLV